MPHLSSNNIPDLTPDPSWSDERKPTECVALYCYTVLYSTPLLDDHKRRSISEVTNSDNIQDITDSCECSANKLVGGEVVTGGLYCTDYLPIIFNLPSSYLAP